MSQRVLVHAWAAALLTVTVGWAQVPEQLLLQGYLTDPSGNPVNGNVTLTVRLYDVPAGGTPLWEESKSVDVASGLYSVVLGEPPAPAVPAASFSGPSRWFALQVNLDPEMSPRLRATSVPYAYRVGSVDQAEGGTLGGPLHAPWLSSAGLDVEGPALIEGPTVTGDLTADGAVSFNNTVEIPGFVAFDRAAKTVSYTDYRFRPLNVASRLTVQVLPGQASKLQEWLDADGSQLAAVAGSGVIETRGGIRFGDGSLQTSAASASGAVALQSSTPGTAQTGHMHITGTGRVGTLHANGGTFTSTLPVVATVVFRRVGGQSASLTEWQDELGGVVAALGPGGELVCQAVRAEPSLDVASGHFRGSSAPGSADILVVMDGAGSERFAVLRSGQVRWAGTALGVAASAQDAAALGGVAATSYARLDAANTFTTGNQQIRTGGDANAGLVVRAHSPSQTGSLLELLASDGTARLRATASALDVGMATVLQSLLVPGVLTARGDVAIGLSPADAVECRSTTTFQGPVTCEPTATLTCNSSSTWNGTCTYNDAQVCNGPVTWNAPCNFASSATLTCNSPATFNGDMTCAGTDFVCNARPVFQPAADVASLIVRRSSIGSPTTPIVQVTSASGLVYHLAVTSSGRLALGGAVADVQLHVASTEERQIMLEKSDNALDKKKWSCGVRADGGVYWVQHTDDLSAQQVFCDMSTEGGGWVTYNFGGIRTARSAGGTDLTLVGGNDGGAGGVIVLRAASSEVLLRGSIIADGGRIHTSGSNLTLQGGSSGGGGGSLILQSASPEALFQSNVSVAGDLCATGFIGPCSDSLYKRNVRTIAEPLAKVERLRGVNYEWKHEQFPGKDFKPGEQIGFIAQEVRSVLPEAVGQSSDGTLFVDYARLTAVLVEAVKEQQRTIAALTGQVEALQTRVVEIDRAVLASR